MATTKTADSGAPENAPEPAKPTPAPSKRVRVRDTNTGQILGHPAPRSWLEQFPNRKEVPSSKAGK